MTRKTATPRPAAKGAETQSVPGAGYDWQDPLALEGELTADERMVQDTARGYAQERLTIYRIGESAGRARDPECKLFFDVTMHDIMLHRVLREC
jgi:hypothetical protein